MTNIEVVDLFKHSFADRTGKEPSTFAWSNQAILAYLLNIKAFFIKDMVKKGIELTSQNYLTLCIELEDADVNDCPCAPPSGCIWKRSIKKLPKSLTSNRITTLTGGEEYSFTEWDKAKNKRNSRVPSIRKNDFFYTIKNSHLYLPLDLDTKVINSTAIYENNYEAILASCQVTPNIICNPFNVEFGGDYDEIQAILERAWRILPSVRGLAAIDVINNDQLDSLSQGVQS